MPAMTPVVRQRPAFEPGEDQVALRADDVFDDAEDVGLELLDLRAVENRPADADHAGPDLGNRHLRRVCLQGGQTEDRDARNHSAEGKKKPICLHESDPVIEEKCLRVKEKWGFV